MAHGFADQTWTLSRIKTLIGRRFHKTYTIQGVALLLRRHGWSCQVPARRAIERDEKAIAGWVRETGPRWKSTAALGAWLVFEDEAGFSMTPPVRRTWVAAAASRSWRCVAAPAGGCRWLPWPATSPGTGPG